MIASRSLLIAFIYAAGLWAANATPPDAIPRPEEFARQTWQSENGLPQNTVQAILQSHEGYIWVGTEGGLARFDGVRFQVFNTRNTPELKSNNIRALRETPGNALWIA
ncbi:MAG: two-component regulator propeller domain-containing protein, partial [Bryobacteraceae bacterium]